MQHHVHAFHAGIHHRAVCERSLDMRVGRTQDVDADGFVGPMGKGAHQRLAEMTRAAGDQDLHEMRESLQARAGDCFWRRSRHIMTRDGHPDPAARP
jgi:hypothetical protein